MTIGMFNKHRLILIAGNTGSGKTVLAKRLAQDTGIRYMEVNQVILGVPNKLIFESTGLGQRTRDVVDMFPNKIVIKCELPTDVAIKRIKHSTKVFKEHEKRMKMTQMQFYWFCHAKLKHLECDMTYNFLEDDYDDVLNMLHYKQ